MGPVLGALLLAAGKAIAASVATQAAGPAGKSLKKKVLGDPEVKAITEALERAWDRTSKSHQRVLAEHDVTPAFLQFEAAEELAKVLLPGMTASPARLAEACVDSLSPGLDYDSRWDRVAALRPVFRTLIEAYEEEVGRERTLDELSGRNQATRTADSTADLARHLGAATATITDEADYLHWVIDNYRYLQTTGMVSNTTVQIPLTDVFVNLTGAPEERPGDPTERWLVKEREQLNLRLQSGGLSHHEHEAALDRLLLEAGRITAQSTGPPAPVDIMAEVRRTQHLLVLGDPGGGKTTLLRYLALRHAQALVTTEPDSHRELGTLRFPVMVRIGDLARSPTKQAGLGDFLAPYLKARECPVPGLADMLERKLGGGQCLLLLDGLDEVSSPADRRTMVDAVTRFTTAHTRAGNRFVITSRIAGYAAAPLPATFNAIRMREMDDPTIARFLDAYCPAIERAEAPEKSATAVARDAGQAATALQEAFERAPGVRRLATNPLLLTALLLVHRARGRLPHRRVDAYVEVTQALGRTWRSVQGVPEADLPDDRMLTTWLTRIGAWMHRNRPEGSASIREILGVLGPAWATLHGKPWQPEILDSADPLESDAGRGVREFLEKTEIHTGLLVERAPGRYGFPHLTFEEYYAGRALAFEGLSAQRPTAIRRHLHDPRYDEPILLALGLVGREQPEEVERLTAEAIYGSVPKPSPYEDLLGRDFLFVLRVLADEIPLATATVDRLLSAAVAEWFDETSRARFDPYREALAQHLSALAGTRAGTRLASAVEASTIEALSAQQQFCQLAGILTTLGPLSSALEAVLVAILIHGGAAMQVNAAAVLAKAGPLPAEAIQLLTADVLTINTRHWPAMGAAAALAQAGPLPAEVAQALSTVVLTTDTQLWVRLEAAEVLAQTGQLQAEAIHVFSEMVLSTDPSVGRRSAAVLSQAGSLADPAVRALTTALTTTTSHPTVRIRAAEVLGNAGPLSVEAAQALTAALLTTNTHPSVRTSAAAVLAQAGPLPAEAIQELTAAVLSTNTHPWVRTKAAEVLSRAGQLPAEAVQPLLTLALTTDAYPSMRIRAAGVLAQAGPLPAEAVQALSAMLTSGTELSVRISAAEILSQAGQLPAEAAQTLLAIVLATDTHPSARIGAAAVLAQAGHLQGEAAQTLLAIVLATGSYPEMRISAAAVLAQAGPLPTEAVQALAAILTYASRSLRVKAADVLTQAGPLPAEAARTFATLLNRVGDRGYLQSQFHRLLGSSVSSIP